MHHPRRNPSSPALRSPLSPGERERNQNQTLDPDAGIPPCALSQAAGLGGDNRGRPAPGRDGTPPEHSLSLSVYANYIKTNQPFSEPRQCRRRKASVERTGFVGPRHLAPDSSILCCRARPRKIVAPGASRGRVGPSILPSPTRGKRNQAQMQRRNSVLLGLPHRGGIVESP